MDNRVIQVLEKILSDRESIKEIELNGPEYYFSFRGGYFSIIRSPKREAKYGPYSFYVYPRWSGTVRGLIEAFLSDEMDAKTMASYHSPEFPEKDRHLLPEVYEAVREKFMNLDAIFDRVLKSDRPLLPPDEDIPF